MGLGINAAGVVVGSSDLDSAHSRAFRAKPGGLMEDLGTLGGPTSGANAINDAGTIVGWATLANMQSHAFVYSDGDGMIDLNDRVLPGSPCLDIPYGINRTGQIVVTYSLPGQVRTYRLTPTTADVTPPTIDSVVATPAVLWPPDGSMRAITVTGERARRPRSISTLQHCQCCRQRRPTAAAIGCRCYRDGRLVVVAPGDALRDQLRPNVHDCYRMHRRIQESSDGFNFRDSAPRFVTAVIGKESSANPSAISPGCVIACQGGVDALDRATPAPRERQPATRGTSE